MTDFDNVRKDNYCLVRTDRRTLSITVDRDGVVTAHAPLRMPLWQIERFLAEKAGWIQTKRSAALARKTEAQQYGAVSGGKLPYLGGEIQVEFWEKKSPELIEDTLYLPRAGSPNQQALKWFLHQAEQMLPCVVADWSRRTGIPISKLRFGHASTRWGSMNAKGEMRLNIALMHCPLEYIHYVVVHELTHRMHMNHSPAFHAAVEHFYPGAARIRAQGKRLAGWLLLLKEEK